MIFRRLSPLVKALVCWEPNFQGRITNLAGHDVAMMIFKSSYNQLIASDGEVKTTDLSPIMVVGPLAAEKKLG